MQKMELRYRWEYDNEERSLRIPITQFILYFACYCWSVQGIRNDLNWRIIIMIVISAGSRMQLTTMSILLSLKRIWVSDMIYRLISLFFSFLYGLFIFHFLCHHCCFCRCCCDFFLVIYVHSNGRSVCHRVRVMTISWKWYIQDNSV